VKYKTSVIDSFQGIDRKPFSRPTEGWTDRHLPNNIPPILWRGHIYLLFKTYHQNKQVKKSNNKMNKKIQTLFSSTTWNDNVIISTYTQTNNLQLLISK